MLDLAAALRESWADEDEEMGSSSPAKWEKLRNSILAIEKGTKDRVGFFGFKDFTDINLWEIRLFSRLQSKTLFCNTPILE